MITQIARNASDWIPLAVTVNASSRTTKEMATAMTRTSEGFASGLAVQNTVDCLFRCVSSSLTNSMRACLSNCGCTYDGGDCFAKTVSGVTVETKFWFVHSSLLDQTVRIRLCCRTVCLLNLCGRDRFLGQAVVFLG